MKKILVMAALAICSFVNAQKGTTLVAGSIGYSSKDDSRGDGLKLNEFNFSPKVGYQFNDNWTIGGELSYTSLKDRGFDLELHRKVIQIGPFMRYSVPLNQTFSVFADFGAGFQNAREETHFFGFDEDTDTAQGAYLRVTPALFINMKKGFGLNFNIGGLGYSTFSYNDYNVNEFNFDFGKGVNFGISKNF